jgi:hypothetical protein
MDALAHFFWKGKMYNNRAASLVTSSEGAKKNSIEVLKDGIITRGVLIDIPKLKNIEWLEPGEGVFPTDLIAAEKKFGVSVRSGDVVLIRLYLIT